MQLSSGVYTAKWTTCDKILKDNNYIHKTIEAKVKTKHWSPLNLLSAKHWSDDLVTAKGRPKKGLLRLWPSVRNVCFWIGHSSTTLGKEIWQAIRKSLPGRSSRPTKRSPAGSRMFYQCSRKAMPFMNLRAAVDRRTLAKQSSVSRNEPSKICLPSSSRRSQIWRSTCPTRPSQNMWSRTPCAWLRTSAPNWRWCIQPDAKVTWKR